MDSNQTSIFKLVSIGRATQNKERNSRFLRVLLAEKATGADGEIAFNPTEEIQEGDNLDGSKYQVKGTQTRDMNCEWYPNEDNRATPPDIMRNEVVEVWRLGNTQRYFWRCMGLKNNLRALESVVYTFGASPKPGGAGIDFASCYYAQWSPMDGHVTFGTSKANGESFQYTWQMNTKKSMLYWGDDIANYFEIDSKERRVHLHNADESFVKVERKVIHIKADEKILLEVGGSTIELTPDSIQQICSGEYGVTSGTTRFTTGMFDII